MRGNRHWEEESTPQACAPVPIGVLTDDPLRLAGLRDLLERDGEFQVTAIADLLRSSGVLPAVALVDTGCVPYWKALSKRLVQQGPLPLLVVVGPEADAEEISQLIGSGAKGYLNYASSEQELRMALAVVLEGSLWAPRKVLARLLERREAAAPPPALTPREQEVLRLLVQGRPNRGIAEELGVDETTVKAHLGRVMRKLGVRNRIALSMHVMARAAGD